MHIVKMIRCEQTENEGVMLVSIIVGTPTASALFSAMSESGEVLLNIEAFKNDTKA